MERDFHYADHMEDDIKPEDWLYLQEYFIGFVQGFAKSVIKKPKAFFRGVSAELLIYGYVDGEYFENSFSSWKAYELKLAQLSSEVNNNRYPVGVFDSSLDGICEYHKSMKDRTWF